jgi:hypothetical protein
MHGMKYILYPNSQPNQWPIFFASKAFETLISVAFLSTIQRPSSLLSNAYIRNL